MGRGIYLNSGGTNNFAVPPVLTFTTQGGSGVLNGTLTAAAGNYVVEIFSNATAPTAGVEQGETFVQSELVTTSGGVGTFKLTEPAGVFYTATPTDSLGNTSQFSKAAGMPALTATTTIVTSSSDPSTVGQPVTFTAVVAATGSASAPTGTVTFTIDGQAGAPRPLGVVAGGDEATFTTSTLSVGPHSITATYSGDATFAASAGSLPTQVVNAAALVATSTALASSSDPSTVGQPVTFTAIVTSADGSIAGGTGRVRRGDDGTRRCHRRAGRSGD